MAYDKNADKLITGQSGQTASGQNILLATAGTGSEEKLGFRSVSLQIIPTGTVSSGVVTFEESNDNTTFVALPLYDDASLTANPISTVTVATGVNRFFSGPTSRRYIRARISTVVAGGGSLQAITVLSPVPYQMDIVTVAQATAGNLNATVAGTVNLGTANVSAAGSGKAEDVAHASGDTGVACLSVRRDSPATAVSAAGDYECLQSDALGRLYVNNQTVTTFNPGFLIFKTYALTNVAQTVKATSGNIFGVNFINVDTTPVYVKIFNVVIGSITVGTTVPDRTILVPGMTGTIPGEKFVANDETSMFHGTAALSVLATTVLAGTGTQTAPTTAMYAEIIYV